MELMQSMAYYIEFQRQMAAARESCADKSSTPLDNTAGPTRDLDEMGFDWPDSMSIERIKAVATEIGMALLVVAVVAAFGLACLLSPTFLS